MQTGPMTHCAACGRSLRGDPERCPSCGHARPPAGHPVDARIGTLVAGDQYRVLRRLGAGGFGIVYEVETLVGGLRRALKVLSARWAHDPGVRERFVREATILEEVHHPNVCRCFAAGLLGSEGEIYLLLELVEGEALTNLLRSEDGAARPLEPRRAVRIARQIAAGLDAAHRAGVIHRDLKPDNVLVAPPHEAVKVVDFGIAKLLEGGAATTTSVAGTPAFMAPEQLEPGRALDPRVDLYALGGVLYAMLTAQTPTASGREGADVLGPRPSELVPALADAPTLDRFVARLLATEPDHRPRDAAEVCEELARIERELAGEPDGGGSRGLLGALCATPSPSAWIALQGYLSSQSARGAGGEAGLVPLASSLLSAWPDALRRAPCAVWDVTKTGVPHPLWPLARALDLSARALDDEDVAKLAANPALATLTRLELGDNAIGNEGVRALARSPHLRQLRHLGLAGNHVTSRGLSALLEEGEWRALESLDLARNGIAARGAAALAAAPPTLRWLDLSSNDLGPDAARALTASSRLAGLRELRLAGNRLGSDGVAALATATSLAGLEVLELARNAVGPSGAAALALGEALRQVRCLDLGQNGLGREGVKLLLGSARFERLDELDLSGNELGPAGAMVFAGAPTVRRLSRLALGQNALGDAGLAALFGSANLTGLRALDLAQNALGASAASLLGEAPPQLAHLVLSHNPLRAAGASALAEALAHLRIVRLEVAGCGLDGAALAAILSAARLEELVASGNPLGADGAALLARLPALGALEAIDLAQTDLGHRGVAALLPHVTNARRLSLGSNRLGDAGAEAIVAAAPRLPRLESLDLTDDGLGPAAAEALAASSLARHLCRLDLSHNALGDAGAEALTRGSGWHALDELELAANGIGLAGASVLIGASGLGFVQRLGLAQNALHGLVDVHSLGKDKAALLEASFGEIARQGSDFAERFYEELFARHPSVRPLFASVDMNRQHQHLLSALALTIDNLRDPDLVERNLRELGRRHVRYGVLPTHYFAVTSVLLDVIRACATSTWSEELELAWSDGLRAISSAMLAHDLEVAPTRT
ncbi:MAG: protein kinase [Myxococcales bacterium]|nr:protein kinase [Myxococcales bacterium]